MRKARPFLSTLGVTTLAAVALAACGGDSSTTPTVTTLTLTPSAATIDFLGATGQFDVTVEDQDGKVMTGVDVTWSSTDPTVATVDQNGRATAIAAGVARIVATAESVADSAFLTVDPAPCSTDLTMSVGDVQVLPVDCALFIPSGASGDRYRLAVLNQNVGGSEGAVTTAAVSVNQVDLVTSPVPGSGKAPAAMEDTDMVEPIRLSLESEKHLRWGLALENRTRAAHRGLRAAEAALFQALGPDAVLPDLGSAQSSPGLQAPDLPQRILLRNNDGNSCSASEPLTPAFLLGQNSHMAVYQDSALSVAGDSEVTAAEAQLVLDYYASYGKSIIDTYFHGVPDIDGNGRIILYIAFNESLDGGATAAYVWGGDLFDAEDCPASNESEVTYFNAALVREVDEGFPQALETAVHEAKHISSFWQGIGRSRVLGISSPFHPSWIEEGSAEIAGNMATRVSWNAVGGPLPNAMVTDDDLRDTAFDANDDILPEALGIVIRLSRAQSYLSSQPNGLVVTPFGAKDGHSVYGSGWTFLRWLGDGYGTAGVAPLADADFFTSQNDSTSQPGINGLEALTGRTFQELLEEYTASVMLHRTGAPAGLLAYTSYDFVRAIELFCFAADNPPCDNRPAGPAGTWPWPVTTGSNGVMAAPFADGDFSGPIGPTGIRIHEFVSDGIGGGIQLRVTANQPAKLVVVRVD